MGDDGDAIRKNGFKYFPIRDHGCSHFAYRASRILQTSTSKIPAYKIQLDDLDNEAFCSALHGSNP